MRYSKTVKYAILGMYCIGTVSKKLKKIHSPFAHGLLLKSVYLPFVIFAPAVALNQGSF
jgi:hypothetical protein